MAPICTPSRASFLTGFYASAVHENGNGNDTFPDHPPLVTKLLAPVLRLLGMSRNAAPVTIVGMTLGLTLGGGLIIQEARSGRLEKRDVFFSITLMGLCHSLIEDPLLMMALGAHLSGTLWARLLFALLAIFLLVNLLRYVPEKTFGRFLCPLPVGGSEEGIG